MKQADFQQAMQGTNAIYNPFMGTGIRFELKSISARWRAPNPKILVLVLDEGSAPLPGVLVKNVYPGGQESFTSGFAAIEFNLGSGSKTPVGEPGPHEIVVGAIGQCDVVKGLGIPNEGHDGYIEFALVYQRVSGTTPPPPPPGNGDWAALKGLLGDIQASASEALRIIEELSKG